MSYSNLSDLSNKLTYAKQFVSEDMQQNGVPQAQLVQFNDQMNHAINFAIQGKIYLNQADMMNVVEQLVHQIMMSMVNDHGAKVLDTEPLQNTSHINPYIGRRVGQGWRGHDRNWFNRWYWGVPGWNGWFWYWRPYFWWRRPQPQPHRRRW